jgi:ribosomal protein S18 acetylase RimI-like enzyme
VEPITTIRPLAGGDVAECFRFGLQAFRPVFASMEQRYGSDLFDRLRPAWESTQATLIESLLADRGRRTWVAERAGVLSGFVVVKTDEATGLADIDMVAVSPGDQRSGIGSRLVEVSLDWLRRSGTAYVQALIRDFPGHDPIRNLLQAAGFAARKVQPIVLYMALAGPGGRVEPAPRIRLSTDADVADCARFGLEAFRPVYAWWWRLYGDDLFHRLEPDWEQAQTVDIRSEITRADAETWVFETAGRATGFLVLTLDEQELGRIELLAVDPEMQRQGVASALNQHAVERCREAAMAYVIVSTASDPGHAPARHSYENVGFKPMAIQSNRLIAKL